MLTKIGQRCKSLDLVFWIHGERPDHAMQTMLRSISCTRSVKRTMISCAGNALGSDLFGDALSARAALARLRALCRHNSSSAAAKTATATSTAATAPTMIAVVLVPSPELPSTGGEGPPTGVVELPTLLATGAEGSGVPRSS